MRCIDQTNSPPSKANTGASPVFSSVSQVCWLCFFFLFSLLLAFCLMLGWLTLYLKAAAWISAPKPILKPKCYSHKRFWAQAGDKMMRLKKSYFFVQQNFEVFFTQQDCWMIFPLLRFQVRDISKEVHPKVTYGTRVLNHGCNFPIPIALFSGKDKTQLNSCFSRKTAVYNTKICVFTILNRLKKSFQMWCDLRIVLGIKVCREWRENASCSN